MCLKDGGRGTCCLRLSIAPSTTQTFHHRHALTLYYCRVWNRQISSSRLRWGRCVSDDALLSLAGGSLIWKHCRAAERHWKASPSQQNWTRPRGANDVQGNLAKTPCWAPARVSTCLRVSQMCTTHLKAHSGVGWGEINGVKQRLKVGKPALKRARNQK